MPDGHGHDAVVVRVVAVIAVTTDVKLVDGQGCGFRFRLFFRAIRIGEGLKTLFADFDCGYILSLLFGLVFRIIATPSLHFHGGGLEGQFA